MSATDFAVKVRYPDEPAYIHQDGLSEEAAAAIADSLNRAYGLGQIATVTPPAESTHGVVLAS